MAAAGVRYEIRSPDTGQKLDYVISQDAAQQIFVTNSDLLVRQESQPEPELEHGREPGRYNAEDATPRREMTVLSTVRGGQEMVVYASGEAFKVRIPEGHANGEELTIDIHNGLEKIAPQAPTSLLPTFAEFLEKKVSRGGLYECHAVANSFNVHRRDNTWVGPTVTSS